MMDAGCLVWTSAYKRQWCVHGGIVVLLLQVYEKLNAEGRFQEKLLEMYRWGKANGWDAAPPVNTAKQDV